MNYVSLVKQKALQRKKLIIQLQKPSNVKMDMMRQLELSKILCKCGCLYPLSDYEYRKWNGYRRGHEATP